MLLLASWLSVGVLSGATPAAATPSPAYGTLSVSPTHTNDDHAAPPLFIRAERVIVRPGEVLEDAQVIVDGGRITAVGHDLKAPEGAQEIQGKTVCAGFIDAWGALGLAPGVRDDRSTSAASRTTDGIDPYSASHLRAETLRAGVTAVRLQGGNVAPVGGIGAVARVAAELPDEQRVLLGDVNVAASAGLSETNRGREVDPFDRIEQVDRIAGLLESGRSYREDHVEYKYELEEWEKKIAEEEEKLEKDFKKAKKAREKDIEKAEEDGKEHKEKRYKEDKKPRAPKYDADREALARVVDGELSFVVQVHRASEIRALLDQTKNFGRVRLILAGGTQAGLFAEELAERGVTVCLWPHLAGTSVSPEYHGHDLGLAAELREAGVDVIFGTGGESPSASRDLPLLASVAVGHGLDREDALHALTLGAARALDVADRVGSVERGKDADLVIMDGEPLTQTARVQYVISGGKVVVTPEG